MAATLHASGFDCPISIVYMEASGSAGAQSEQPPGQPASIIATLIGTAIALFTLILPLYVIAHYSSPSSESLGPSQIKLVQKRD
jgi:hypothetical protein